MRRLLESVKNLSRKPPRREVSGRGLEAPEAEAAEAKPTKPTKRNRRVRPRTYSVAVYIVVGLILVEVVAVFSIFYFRRVVINISTQAPPILVQHDSDVLAPESGNTGDGLNPLMPETLLSKIKPRDGKGDPPISVMSEEEEEAVAEETEEDPQKIALAREEARRIKQLREQEQARKQAEEKNQKIRAYIEQSNRFLREEDFANAKRMLKRALSLNREDPVTLRSLAMLAKAEGRPNESILYWRQLVSLGPELGDVYLLAKEEVAAAEAKVKLAAAEAQRSVPAGRRGAGGGKFIIRSFEKVVSTENEALADDLKLSFDVALNGVTREDLDNLFVEVFFYDYMPGKVVPGAGETAVAIEGSEVDWLDEKQMRLVASYALDAQMAKNTNRRYHGYLVRIYFDKKLQDKQAEPVELLHLVQPKF